MIKYSNILKKILKNGNFSFVFRTAPYLGIVFTIYNLTFMLFDKFIGKHEFPFLRITLSGTALFFSIIYFYNIKRNIFSKIAYELFIAVFFSFVTIFFMFVQYTPFYMFNGVLVGGLLYGMASGYFLIPILLNPIIFFSSWKFAGLFIDNRHVFNIHDSIGIFIVIYFSAICAVAVRIGFDVFYYLRIALDDQHLQLANLEKISELDIQKSKIEQEINNLKELEAMGRFAGGIAHDFNNQLTIIAGQAMSLKRTSENKWEKEKFDLIIKTVKKNSELIKNLLSTTRQQENSCHKFDLKDTVASSLKLATFGRDIQSKINFNTTNKEFYVNGDQNAFQNCLTGLFYKLTDYIKNDGSLTIELSTLIEIRSEVQIKSQQSELSEKKMVLLKVHTTKVTIINSTEINVPYFVKDITESIRSVDGYITYDIKENDFSISLHIPESYSPPEKQEENKLPVANIDATIMIVDDEELVLEYVEDILTKNGYIVTPFQNGNDAAGFYELNHSKIDLVISDMQMPHLSGKDLCNRLKKFNPGVKILVLSGYSNDKDTLEVMNSGISGFLDKPFTDDELCNKIQKILRK